MGTSPPLVALVGALAVMLVSFYLVHGVTLQTTMAVVGTRVARGATVLLGVWFIDQAALTGFSSEEATFARFAVEGFRPDRWDVLGGAICLVGMTVIMYAPRG